MNTFGHDFLKCMVQSLIGSVNLRQVYQCTCLSLKSPATYLYLLDTSLQPATMCTVTEQFKSIITLTTTKDCCKNSSVIKIVEANN